VLGDLLLRSAVAEHGTQRLVAAVIRVRGVGEELPVRGVVHNGCSLGGRQSNLGDGPRARLIETARGSKAIGRKSREKLVLSLRPGSIWAWRNDRTTAESELTTAREIPQETLLQPARMSSL
jgi:hypothetical protein